jgi:hypothetical protein
VTLFVVHGLAILLAPVICLSACVNTSPDRVKLTASVMNVALSVTQGSLVATLSGTFDVELDVGDLASGSATITDPPSFQLVLVKDQKTLKLLDALPSGGGFPLTVKTGEHRTLSFTLSDRNTLDGTCDLACVCAGPVEIVGSLRDTLTADRPMAFESGSATLSGCPRQGVPSG